LFSEDLKFDEAALSKFRDVLGSSKSSGGLKNFSVIMDRDKLREK
jgi:hypothetical protein